MRILGRVYPTFVALVICLGLLVADGPALAKGLTPIQQPEIFSGLKIPTYMWSNGSQPPRAIVVAVHGGCLHGRAYRGLGRLLSDQNFLVVSLDMRGFGKWCHSDFGSKQDATFQYDESKNDIQAMLVRLRERFPGVPVYLLGESLGANVAMSTAADAPTLVDGVIAVSPFSGLKWFFSPYMVLHAAQVATLPMTRLNFNPYLRTRLAHRDAPILEEIRDPMSRNKQTIRELYKSFRVNYGGLIDSKRMDEGTPILVLVGGKDRLTNPKSTVKIFPGLPAEDKRLVVLKQSGHLLVETTKIDPQAASTVIGWINQHSRNQVATRMTTTKARRI